jgi:hypothetical protein
MFRKRSGRDEKPRCSFCGRGEDATELIPSPLNDSPLNPPCYICADCVAACTTIVDDKQACGGAPDTSEEQIVPRLRGAAGRAHESR